MADHNNKQNADMKSMWQYEIVDTGWRGDGLFAVILGAETAALLEKEEAHDYARIVAGRRRHGTPVTVEQVEEGTGKLPFQRMFCFRQSDK